VVRVVFKQWSELSLKSGYSWPKSGLILLLTLVRVVLKKWSELSSRSGPSCLQKVVRVVWTVVRVVFVRVVFGPSCHEFQLRCWTHPRCWPILTDERIMFSQPRVPNRVTGTCSQTLNLRHWRIFFLLSICYPLKKNG